MNLFLLICKSKKNINKTYVVKNKNTKMHIDVSILANFMLIPTFIIVMNKVIPNRFRDQYYQEFIFVSSACLLTYSIIVSFDKTINIISDCLTCSS